MSRRARALAFLTASMLCAVLAAAAATRYRSSAEGRYGPLRPVLVAAAELPAGELIGPAEAGRALVVRRVPASFVPPGSLRHPQDAVGRQPGATISAGSYVIGAQLALPAPERPPAPGAGRGRAPVQVGVVGAEALLLGGGSPEGSRVDVVVGRQAGLGSAARARVVASGARLLALRGPQGAGEGWSATLALTREEALELISIEAGATEIRLLPLQ